MVDLRNGVLYFHILPILVRVSSPCKIKDFQIVACSSAYM